MATTRPHSKNKQLPVIGRHALVSFPSLGIVEVLAKVDTGAASSSIHAENIHVEINAGGQDELVFEIPKTKRLKTKTGGTETVRTTAFTEHKVRSSNGGVERRYYVTAELKVGGVHFLTPVSLNDRSTLSFPVLIGRRTLHSHFLVDASLDERGLFSEMPPLGFDDWQKLRDYEAKQAKKPYLQED
ncbi:MAG TPA: RimK/LysX family protein [Candidatus Saccharimonadales bacterium]|nr:RimK/LysX family protein [Candidatus Saccharimonadales bacterium]